MLQPERLAPGDTIMFVAPAGDLDKDRMMLAKERLEDLGYEVKMRRDLFAAEGYLAGTDKRRAKELMQAFLDPEVDAIFPGTGGYGSMRIFDRLDFEAIRALALEAAEREAGIHELQKALGVSPLVVVYEDFVCDYEQTVRDVLDYLGLGGQVSEIPPPLLARTSNQVNEEWVARYLSDLNGDVE